MSHRVRHNGPNKGVAAALLLLAVFGRSDLSALSGAPRGLPTVASGFPVLLHLIARWRRRRRRRPSASRLCEALTVGGLGAFDGCVKYEACDGGDVGGVEAAPVRPKPDVATAAVEAAPRRRRPTSPKRRSKRRLSWLRPISPRRWSRRRLSKRRSTSPRRRSTRCLTR